MIDIDFIVYTKYASILSYYLVIDIDFSFVRVMSAYDLCADVFFSNFECDFHEAP